jgi:streptogramin lyase
VPVFSGDHRVYHSDAKQRPEGITAGPDGNLWFTEGEFDANKIGRITPAGVFTEFQLPGSWTGPLAITAGPDGNLWFTASQTIPSNPGSFQQPTNRIGRITPSGDLTEFDAPNGTAWGITAGPDGNLWYVSESSAGSLIGRVTPAGDITTFAVPTALPGLTGITTGPDGNLWFTEATANKIGRITPSGTITEFALPASETEPSGIVAGPDGNLWFAGKEAIGRMTPGGTLTLFSLPAGHSGATGITVGADGNLWFTEFKPNTLIFEGVYIGSITTSGTITEYLVPSSNDYMNGITAGPDGNIWFVESAGKIGHLVMNAPDITEAPSLIMAPNNIFTGTVATFTDSQVQGPGQYSATIEWGDGSSNPGTVTATGPQFVVTASHAFGGGFAGGSMPVSVILHAANGVATAALSQVLVITPQAAFVEQLYADLLHRQADAPGLNGWVSALNAGASRFQVALAIQQSVEYRTDVISDLYGTLLGRSPDPGGLAAFLGFLNQGGSAEQVEQIILGSAEFYQRAGGTTAGFVSALYHAALGRTADASGAASFGALLASGGSTGLAAGLVLSSPEFKQDLVQSFYQRLLHRAADPGGLANAATALAAGIPDAVVIAALASSDEMAHVATG